MYMSPTPRTDLRSRSLDLLRFPLALFVVAVHVFAPLPFVDSSLPSAHGLYNFVAAFIKDQSVPVYFFIAGYVFFLGLTLTKASYLGKLRRRCHSLLIPYMAWNTLAILYALKAFLPGVGEEMLSAYDVTVQSVAECFWDDRFGILPYASAASDGIFPIDKPLWFVRDLMLLAIASPAIYALYRLPGRYAAGVLIAATVVWALRVPSGHLAQLTEGFVFFAWGGYFSYHRRDMMVEFNRFFTASAVMYPLLAAVILFAGPGMTAAVYLKSVNIIVGLFFFYNISALLVSRYGIHVNRFLTSSSFFVYCGHFILLDPVTRRMASILTPESNMGILVFYALSYVVIIGILLVSFALLRRYLPAVLAIFTGGRR